jgi:uncharacterized protein YgbK (DUF1537 family)
MIQRCLLIADDLTGGADAGAQFAKRGVSTLLISLKDHSDIDFSKYTDRDVLVLNTDSRGLSPEKAFHLASSILKGFENKHFPVIYKKIDSTLRGNIGYELDAILEKTDNSMCFMAPSYPEQDRTLVGGIMMVRGKPLALTEVARDTASPVQESHVYKLLEQQSSNRIGRIDLTLVASSREKLRKAVEDEQRKGNKIVIFDAVIRQDLTNIVEVAFSIKRTPLLVGSAGLAEEVAKKLTPLRTHRVFDTSQKRVTKPFKHLFIISGSTSSVTQQQLKEIEQRGFPVYQLKKSLLVDHNSNSLIEIKELSSRIAKSLIEGRVVLKTYSEVLQSEDVMDFPIHHKITKTLAHIVLLALEESNVDAHDLVLILTGGDTALSVINILRADGVEIEGELLEGIVRGHLIGGDWDGLTVITKAGAFGKGDALERIMQILGTGSPLFKEQPPF